MQNENRYIAGSYDLHIHSVFSDGSKTARELIEDARAVGLAGIAVMDHDCLAQLSSVRAVAREMDYPVLAGAELSCIDGRRGRIVHILAYGLEASSDGSGPVEAIARETLALRTANSLWQAWRLVRAGVSYEGSALTLDAVMRAADASTGVYKQHVMWALTKLAYCDEAYQRIYRKLFKNGGIAQRDIVYPDVSDVVRAVREQGGVPVLAHPRQTDSWDAVPELVRAGLLGIEAYHPDHDAGAETRAREAAHDRGLLVTGGSDYHGVFGAPTSVAERFIMPGEAGERVEELFLRERHLS